MIEASLRALLEAAAEAGARRALADAPAGGARLVPIRESRIGYRAALRAVADGTLPAFRVGRSTYLRVEDEDEWIARPEHRVRPGESVTEDAPDEIGELIALNRGRR